MPPWRFNERNTPCAGHAEPWPNFNIQAGYQYSVEGPLHDQGFAQFYDDDSALESQSRGHPRRSRSDMARRAAALQRTENELSQQTAQALGHLPGRRPTGGPLPERGFCPRPATCFG